MLVLWCEIRVTWRVLVGWNIKDCFCLENSRVVTPIFMLGFDMVFSSFLVADEWIVSQVSNKHD